MNAADKYLDDLMHQHSFIDKVLAAPNHILSFKDKQEMMDTRLNRINSLSDRIDTVNYFNTLQHNINEKPRYRGTDERFDFKQLEEDRIKAKYNQPSNPYIKKGMGVLSTINDFAPPVAIVKAADTITDQVSKGQYGEAAKTLGWELAMTNPAAKLIGKGVKKLRGIPSSVYGGPLRMTDKAPTFTPEQLSKIEKLRLDQLKGLEDKYDMLIHSSRSKNLDLDTFNFRPSNLPDKAAYGKGPGIFTHGARDADKYNDFGPYKYGVLVRKDRPTYPSKIDSNDPRGEVFVPRDTVEDIFLLE